MKTEDQIRARMEEIRETEYTDPLELIEWVLSPADPVHVGADHARTEHKADGWFNREKVFSDKWIETNNPPSFLNGGIGTLRHLACTRPTKGGGLFGSGGYEIYRRLTQEEATAAAGAIQWLGTNCGWCWLEECIRACGFDIIARRQK